MTADTMKPATESEPATRDRRSVLEMLGEVMREVAVLLFVFIPLDLAIRVMD